MKPRFIYSASNDWFQVNSEIYSSILCSHITKISEYKYQISRNSHLYVNGIFIRKENDNFHNYHLINNYHVTPNLKILATTTLITDGNGSLPINLQRNDLTHCDERLSLSLRQSLSQDLLAQILAYAPETTPFTKDPISIFKSNKLHCTIEMLLQSEHSPWCWENDGWKISDPSISFKSGNILELHSNINLSSLKNKKSCTKDISIIYTKPIWSHTNMKSIVDFIRFINKGQNIHRKVSDNHYRGHSKNSKETVLIGKYFSSVFSKNIAENFRNNKNIPQYLNDFFIKNLEQFSNVYALSHSIFDHAILDELKKITLEKNNFYFTISKYKNNYTENNNDLLTVLWNKFLGDASIPVSFEERKQRFPKAFEEFGERIEYYREIIKKK